MLLESSGPRGCCGKGERPGGERRGERRGGEEGGLGNFARDTLKGSVVDVEDNMLRAMCIEDRNRLSGLFAECPRAPRLSSVRQPSKL